MSLITIIIAIAIVAVVGIVLFYLFSWMGGNIGRVAACIAIACIAIAGVKFADAPKTIASGGNPLAPIMKVLPANADTSVYSTKVNGVGAAGGLKDGGVSKSMGKGAEGFNL